MTTSGSRNFTVSRAEIIEEAVANIGALDPGNTLSAEEEHRASLRLNLMVKGWMTRGANLWRREEVILFLQSGQQSYVFGTDHFARADEVVATTLSVTSAAAAVTVTVTSAAGIATADTVGIKLDSGVIHWDTVTVAGSVLTFAPGLPSQASSGNAVYAYTTAATNPVKVAFAYLRDSQNTDSTVTLMSREEYTALSRKGSSGPVSQIYHDRQLTSRIMVWPAVNTQYDKLHLIVDRVVEDFDSVADTPDFPVEWLNALMWGLSAELANTYGLPIQERQWLKQNALVEFDAANTFDIEETTVRFEYQA